MILVALNITRVNKIEIRKENVGARVGSSSAKNPRKDNVFSELQNECIEQQLKKDKLIVSIMIAKKVG